MLQFPELNALIVELGTEASQTPERARHATQVYAARIKSTAQTFAPRRTGELARSISYSTSLVNGGATAEIGPTARHGRFVEWGTYKDAPQAFMGPALDRHSQDFVDELARIPFGYKAKGFSIETDATGRIVGTGDLDIFG